MQYKKGGANVSRSILKEDMKMKLENMTSPRTGKAVANQFVIDTGKERYFQSYSTIICKYGISSHAVTIDNGAHYDEDENDGAKEFSKTTIKYLIQFFKNYTAWNISNKAQIVALIADGTFKREDLNE